MTIKCKIKPLSHWLIVETRVAEKKSKGGILMTSKTVSEGTYAATEGKIVALAPDCFDWYEENERPKIGDIVHFIKYEGIGKCYNEKDYRIISDQAIHGISSEYLKEEDEVIIND
jgi:co-chaperonin GroES (HSP10)